MTCFIQFLKALDTNKLVLVYKAKSNLKDIELHGNKRYIWDASSI